MIGQTISHYRVVSQLGSGGMGVVYAAEDPRLGRQVALKFVSDEMVKDASTIQRLTAEARTTSSLNHPNICTIYDIGEHEGRPFIVMEILKGRTLRDRLAEGPLKISDTIDLGIQVAEALVAAHGRDIIHRDIKPANVFLVDHGPVKVLDFGLAKSVTSQVGFDETVSPTADLTAVGTTVGTVSYMSPEQVSGETLDRRTDLFSLGVVLYECVTGRQPFQGKTSAVILASILTQQPAPPTALNASVPAALQDVINKCLEKDRELRYQDAAGLRADLKRIKRDLDSGALRVAGATRSLATVAVQTATPASASIATEPQPSTPSVVAAASQPRNRTVIVAVGAAVAIVAIAAGVMFSRHETSPTVAVPVAERSAEPAPAATPDAAPPPNAPATNAPAVAPAQAPDVPRGRTGSAASSPRLDAAIVEGNRQLAAGNAEAATRALNTARAIDPASPAVADLSARLVEFYKSEAARRPSEPARTQPAASPPPGPVPVTTQAAPASSPSIAEPPTVTAALPAPSLPSRPEAAERRAATSAPPASSPPPSSAAEDDDAAIRRVIGTYARAIETKDLALYRSVKPNLSPAEQRTIEDGFRAVTSQRVTVNIQSIEHRAQEAVVRLRRQDVIQAGGRQQTSDSQQTVTLTRAAGGWVIREIGR